MCDPFGEEFLASDYRKSPRLATRDAGEVFLFTTKRLARQCHNQGQSKTAELTAKGTKNTKQKLGLFRAKTWFDKLTTLSKIEGQRPQRKSIVISNEERNLS